MIVRESKVELILRKLCCKFEIKLLVSRYQINLVFIIFSSNFVKAHIMNIDSIQRHDFLLYWVYGSVWLMNLVMLTGKDLLSKCNCKPWEGNVYLFLVNSEGRLWVCYLYCIHFFSYQQELFLFLEVWMYYWYAHY